MRAPEGPSTLRDLVEGLAQHGDRPALLHVHGGKAEALSYAEIGARALSLAGALAAPVMSSPRIGFAEAARIAGVRVGEAA